MHSSSLDPGSIKASASSLLEPVDAAPSTAALACPLQPVRSVV